MSVYPGDLALGGPPPPSPAATAPVYLVTDDVKASLALTGQSFADADIALAISAASRAIDGATGRRFYLDVDANQVRYYSPRSYKRLELDDIAVLTSVQIDRGGTGTYSETWTNGVQFVLEPFNAPADFRPYERLTVRALSGQWMPTFIEQSVKVTAQFGWAVMPDDIKAATSILTAKLLRRVREAPFGIVTAGIDQGVAMRIARTDPDVYSLLRTLDRSRPLI